MKSPTRFVTLLVCTTFVSGVCLFARQSKSAHATKPQARTLCAADERVIFSCVLRQTAKSVSVCASKDLTNEKGYLQYRFGMPGKIELEFPKDRANTQQQFE